MAMDWAAQELKDLTFQDKRLDKRFLEIVSSLANQPRASIPAACGGRAETSAAYRFFDNDKVTFDNVLTPHINASAKRIESQKVIIAVQDTTEIELTRPNQQVKGAGPLDGATRRGGLLHLLHAFTPDGTPLGAMHAKTWTREDGKPKTSAQTRSERSKIPLEEKESFRWIDTFRDLQDWGRLHPNTQIISVSDSESDIYEMMSEGLAAPSNVQWIIRACQERALNDLDKDKNAHMTESIRNQPVLFEKETYVRGRKSMVSGEKRSRVQSRDSRKAWLTVRAGTVTLRPPWRSDKKLPPVTLRIVLVEEPDPPAGETPISWILLTSLPITTVEEVQRVIQCYTTRWMIEIYFRTLKSGCLVENRRFETWDRMLPCLAVYMIIAWRTLYVCRLARSCPDESCEVVFETSEWQSVSKVVTGEVPEKPPRLKDMVLLVARLGGFVNTAKNAEPGPQTIWLGLQRTYDMAMCWDTFGPGAKKDKKDV